MILDARVARSLESGRGGTLSRLASRVWGAASASRVARPLTFRDGAYVIAVGGSTLGGSGKTPLAVACAKRLAEGGHAVALVGHAYGGRPPVSRVVTADDDVDVVGDEALAAARELASTRVAVVVGPTRQAALDHALALADIAVIDGVLQLSPRPAHLALLAVDAYRPWGVGACPPSGDLRASVDALLSAADRVVVVGDARPPRMGDVRVDVARAEAKGARLGTAALAWDHLRTRRIGLSTSLARPDRIVDWLARRGVAPVLVAAHADHETPPARTLRRMLERARELDVDLWLASGKCATHLPPRLDEIPVATLDYELVLGALLAQALLAKRVQSAGRARLTEEPRGL